MGRQSCKCASHGQQAGRLWHNKGSIYGAAACPLRRGYCFVCSVALKARSIMAETFTKVVAPTLGLVLSNAMFAAPLAQVDAARKAGALGALNPLPFVAIFSNCVLCVPSLTPGCQPLPPSSL